MKTLSTFLSTLFISAPICRRLLSALLAIGLLSLPLQAFWVPIGNGDTTFFIELQDVPPPGATGAVSAPSVVYGVDDGNGGEVGSWSLSWGAVDGKPSYYEVYERIDLDAKNGMARNTVNFLQQQMDLLYGDISSTQDTIVALKKDHNMLNLSIHATDLLKESDRLTEKKSELETQLQ